MQNKSDQGRKSLPFQISKTMKTTDRLIKAFEKFNEDLKEFGEQTGEVFVTLYEDANTTREVANFKLYKNGKLTWIEMEDTWKNGQRVHESRHEEYLHTDDDDIQDTPSFGGQISEGQRGIGQWMQRPWTRSRMERWRTSQTQKSN